MPAENNVQSGTLREQLQSSLGDALVLGAELGGGGMSRVFVATDTRLGRQVVVKVLAPELSAGLSVERFEREIRMAATMQHPLIVPLLAAGVTAGALPYYTMPLVEGESLRARLIRDPQPPLTDVMRMLRDIGEALGYAHDKRIVHRDIKPDNVLLSRGHAVVTDFGIARAIVAASHDDDRLAAGELEPAAAAALTATGVSLGTPAYMAPEQIVGDSRTDHRADMYAVGCVAYELLAGHAVFEARSPQELCVAHLVERPNPLGELRPDVPHVLTAFVMRCLEKLPGDRPQHGAELVRVIDETVGSAGVAIPVIRGEAARRYRGRLAGRPILGASLAIAGLVGLLMVAYVTTRVLGVGPFASLLAAHALPDRPTIVVADFATAVADSTLGPVLADAVRADLGQSHAVYVMPLSTQFAALQRMRRPTNTRLEGTLARDLAEREGVSAVVDGGLARVGSAYVVTLRLVLPHSGDELVSYREIADGPTTLLATLGQLTRKMRGRIGESLSDVRATPPLAKATTSSLEAFQKYAAGLRANSAGSFVEAITKYEQAVAVDSTFASAWMRLGTSLTNTTIASGTGFRVDRQHDAFVAAYRLRDRLPDVERLAVEAEYYTWVVPDFGKVVTAQNAMLAIDSTNAVIWNNIGMKYRYRGEHATSERYFRRAAQLSPDVPLFGTNVCMTLINLGHYAEADSMLRGIEQRFPNVPVARRMRMWLLLAHGPLDSLEQVSSRLPTARERSWSERLRGRLRQAQRLQQASLLEPSPFGARTAAFVDSLTELEIILDPHGISVDAIPRLEALLAHVPLVTMPPRERPYFAVAADFAHAGLPARARAILGAYEREVTDTIVRREREWERRATLGEVFLAEGHWQEAVNAFTTADAMSRDYISPCPSCVYEQLGRAYDAAGRRDSAIANYERYLTKPFAVRLVADARYRARMERRLGELYAAGGDPQRAVRHYENFVALWRDADPELQPQVKDAERQLTALRKRPRS